MKKVLSLIGAAAMLFAVTVQAQNGAPVYGFNTVYSGIKLEIGTSNFPTGGYLIDVRKMGNVAFQQTLRGATTATNVLVFAKSIDGISFDTNKVITWSIDSASALPVTVVTNVSVSGIGYLALINASNTQLATNTLSYSQKISAP